MMPPLKSIERIARPWKGYLGSQAENPVQLGTQSLRNTQFRNRQSITSTKAIALGQYNCRQKPTPFTGGARSYYRLNRMQESCPVTSTSMSLCPRRRVRKCIALAYYNLAYMASTKRLCNGTRPFLEIHPTAKKTETPLSLPMRITPYRRLLSMSCPPFRRSQTILHPGGKP